jgi:hypothetical protein
LQISDEELAARIAGDAISKHAWPGDALHELIARATSTAKTEAEAASRIFFRSVVEKLCDLFDAEATRVYSEMFAQVVAQALPNYSASALLERYNRIRHARVYRGRPKRVCVLSRVTLGADVAVSSMVLAAAKQCFPEAEICFVGPSKNAALFESDSRVKPIHTVYGRSAALLDRLRASEALQDVLNEPETLVMDPDSRLTQLGIMPVTQDSKYLFFESRAYGGTSSRTLTELTAQWLNESLGADGIRPYLHPRPDASSTADITISLGVGENTEKLGGEELEREAVATLAAMGRPVLIDAGAGGEETRRVENLVRALGAPENIHVHYGSFASFAAHIMQSRLYFGYDSAGQHAAAASGVPLVTVFAGYATERTFERWYPSGPGPIWVIKGNDPNCLEKTLASLTSAAAEAGLS